MRFLNTNTNPFQMANSSNNLYTAIWSWRLLLVDRKHLLETTIIYIVLCISKMVTLYIYSLQNSYCHLTLWVLPVLRKHYFSQEILKLKNFLKVLKRCFLSIIIIEMPRLFRCICFNSFRSSDAFSQLFRLAINA